MTGRCLRWMAVFAISLQVAGCYTEYGPIAEEPRPIANPVSVANRFQPGETLKVIVYGEEALSGPYLISPAGDINMPLAGSIHAAGRTKAELEQDITRRYNGSKLLQEPKVTVDVIAYRPIFVLGETLRPGAYPYSSGLNVLTAITLAGGFSYRASRDKVFIQHAGEAVWQEYPLSASVAIAPGDLIRIPERYF
jgi:protein involved in polysaccharide export with SLBB domain